MAGPWDRGPRPPRPPQSPRTPVREGAPQGRHRHADADTLSPRDAGTRWQHSADAPLASHAAHAAHAGSPGRPVRREELRLYGLNAVDAVFRRRPEAIRKVYLVESRIAALKPLLAWCVKHRVGYRVVGDEDLERLAASSHHEGVVADVLKTEPRPLDDWLRALAPGAPALAIWLDGVGNPHNFGAILRAAAHFGAAVLLPAESDLALSGAAARVAEGGAEAVPLVRLPRGEAALARLRGAGFVLAATVVRGGEDLFALSPPARLAYVMGAEGEGMGAALAAACDRRVSIPGSGAVESLNVASATAVFLAHWSARNRSAAGSGRP